jgi:S-adenosylmethionine:tRNA ribosyltransferase-isomerase
VIPADEPGGAGPASGFDYELPPDRIAQHPAAEREAARLMLVSRGGSHPPVDSIVRDLPGHLRPGDLLVVNRSRVFPARLRGRRVPEGGAVELLLVAPSTPDTPIASDAGRGDAVESWRVLARPARRLRCGQRIALLPGPTAPGPAETMVEVRGRGEGWLEIAFPPGTSAIGLAERIGETPLPPYIRRPDGPTAEDESRYQTVYAREAGSIAAPTAGLHLTAPLLDRLRARGVATAEVVLHVGPATFLAGQPGRAALAVEPERYEVPGATREAIERTRSEGRGRVIAVGTTTTRALESASRAGWPRGLVETSLVLSPGSRFEVVEGLLTNFHLPGSSLLALVAAFAGIEAARHAYRAAVDRGYRFYSYGDAMLVA